MERRRIVISDRRQFGRRALVSAAQRRRIEARNMAVLFGVGAVIWAGFAGLSFYIDSIIDHARLHGPCPVGFIAFCSAVISVGCLVLGMISASDA